MTPITAIIVAAGRGIRAGGSLPKQYRPLGDRPVLTRTVAAFLSSPRVERLVCVIHPDDAELFTQAMALLAEEQRAKLTHPVPGGATRQASVRAGLEALASDGAGPIHVLVHDAARPFVSPELIVRAAEAAQRHGAAVPGVPVTDTVKLVDENDRVADTPRRDRLRAVQTPQAFGFAALLDAHRKAADEGLQDFTDDGALAEWAGFPVMVFDGDPANSKLTSDKDFTDAERRLRGDEAVLVTRVGTGFDVHAMTEGDHLWLGGVRIASDRGVTAHSDGDVVLHALTDALLGCIADGDIGVHFPPSDPQWRGASSDRFLADAAGRVRERGGRIDHLDVTVLCEAPRIGPHREAMRQRIADIAGISPGSVSIKATTTEQLGFTGRREGLAAQASATVRLPTADVL